MLSITFQLANLSPLNPSKTLSRSPNPHFKSQLRNPHGNKSKTLTNKNQRKKEIVLFDSSSPPLSDLEKSNGAAKIGEFPSLGSFKRVPKRVLAVLSNLPLAIGEMFTIAALMALEENSVLGIFSWRWVLGLGFDHMFTSPVFLGILVLLAASLMSCTYTTQIPLVKVARRSSQTLFHEHQFRTWV